MKFSQIETIFILLIVSCLCETFVLGFLKAAVKPPRLLLKIFSVDPPTEDDSKPSQPQMEVIPFDYVQEFAKDDLPTESKEKKDDRDKKSTGMPRLGGQDGKSLEQRLQEAYRKNLNRPREEGWIENPDRPTGYGLPDAEDNEAEMRKRMEDDIVAGKYVPDDPPDGVKDEFVKLLKDIYIGSPYDSRKKQQARYVIRNITGISVLFGIVFTVIWYAFPGRFISTVKDRDFAARYSNLDFYKPPSGLMQDDIDANVVDDKGYIGDAAPPAPQTHFEYDAPRISVPRAPKPSIEL